MHAWPPAGRRAVPGEVPPELDANASSRSRWSWGIPFSWTLRLCARGRVAALGATRWHWWDWWIDRKTRWVRDEQPQLAEGVFRALAAGTGLPPIHQRSNFAFRSVRDGADRFLGHVQGGRAAVRADLHAPRQPDDRVPRAGPLPARGAPRHREGARRGRDASRRSAALIFGSGHGRDLDALPLAPRARATRSSPGNVYGCTDSLLRGLSKFGVEAVFCDMGDLAAVESALDEHPNVALVFLESPENPTLRLADIERISRLTEERGILARRRQHVLLALPPAALPPRRGLRRALADEVRQRPLDVGRRRGPRPVPVHEDGPLPLVQGPRRHALALRLVAELHDGPEPRRAPEGAVRERGDDRRRSCAATRRSRTCIYPGFARLPAGRPRPPADAQRRGDRQLRPDGRRRRRARG